MTNQVTCPACQGSTYVEVYVEGVGRRMLCQTCAGAGSIPIALAERIAYGQRVREARCALDQTQREFAEAIGFNDMELSKCENRPGQIDDYQWSRFVERTQPIVDGFATFRRIYDDQRAKWR